MTDEQQVVQPVAEESAPEQVVTATPEAEVAVTPEEKPAEPPKVFTQEELDEKVGKRLAREERKWQRELAALRAEIAAKAQPATPPAAEATEPQATDPWALAEQIAEQREAAKRKAEIDATYREREEDVREKYADFEQVAYNPALPITQAMAETIHESDIGPEIAYYLGSNPTEAKRISQLSPLAQAKELGKIEDRLTKEPPAKKTTTAPPPIAPVKGQGSGNPSYDTTDPRSISTMSTSEWIEKERLRQIKKLESQRLR